MVKVGLPEANLISRQGINSMRQLRLECDLFVQLTCCNCCWISVEPILTGCWIALHTWTRHTGTPSTETILVSAISTSRMMRTTWSKRAPNFRVKMITA